jgi:molybdenum cofactor cytidylyltransferase
MQTAAIILAAGAATRMGKIKQLLPFQGETLLARAIRTARESAFHPIIVVLGAEAESIRKEHAVQQVSFVENYDCQSGMGSSIAAGVRQLQSTESQTEAVAVLLADQPMIEAGALISMAAQLAEATADAIAAKYSKELGAPAIFRKKLFAALLSLNGQPGARAILRNPSYSVLAFDLPQASMDVDTPQDFAALNNAPHSS